MTEKNVEWDRFPVIPTPRNSSETASVRATASDTDQSADLPAVLGSLEDEKCRTILSVLDGPTSATELCEACGMASSTVYRKLERLGEAKLVREYTEVRRNGPNATLYERDFTRIALDVEDGEFSVSIERPETDATDRMATFWSEMKEES